ncbi:MAG: transporter substrate-binding domain-containing protein [Amphritea sp.]
MLRNNYLTGLCLNARGAMEFMKKIILAVTLILFCAQAYSQTLVIGRIEGAPDHQLGAAIIEEAYKRINVVVEFKVFPGQRALVQSSSGKVDGEMQRIYEVGDLYPTLIRVPTPFTYMDAAVFSKDEKIVVSGWSSLNDYKVGIVRGDKYAEIGLRDVENVVLVSGTKSLLRMLDAGRVDIVVTTIFDGLYGAKKHQMQSIRPIYPILARIPLYFYLHEKNKHLVAEIDRVFKSMQQSGELEELRLKFAKELLNDPLFEQ